MKKQITGLFGLIALATSSLYSQSTISGIGPLGHTGLSAADWCGWNALSTIPLNVEHRGNNRINFLTYGYRRMFVDFGASGGQTTGRTAIGNDLGIFGTVLNPVDRLTLYEVGNTGSVQIRFQNNSTGVTATRGYAIGMDNTNRVVNHTQYEARQMRWLLPDSRQAGSPVKEWMRIENNRPTPSTLNASQTTDGYIGLNNPAPDFHIDAITPAITGLELFNSFRTSDVPNSRMGMCNGTTFALNIIPTFFGSVDGTQTNPALQTIASIVTSQDVAANTTPVTRFRSGRDWVPNTPGGMIKDLDEVRNRYAFSWMNGLTTKMHMTARGELRIGDNLVSGTPSNVAPPRNRIEITADVVDPYGSAIATNGASGIRLTHLTSAKTPLINGTNGVNNTKVLTVDSAGVIVLVTPPAGPTGPPGPAGPAGPAGPGLGNICNANTNPLTSNWEIPLNNHNFLFGGQGTANYNVGIGTSCAPNSKLQILQSSSNVGSIALQVDNTDVEGIAVNAVANGPFAVKGLALLQDPNTLVTTGVYGEADYNSTKSSFGVYGVAKNSASTNSGGYFRAVDTGNSPYENMGVNAEGRFADNNYGGRFNATGYSNTANYGIYATALGTAGSGNSTAIYGAVYDPAHRAAVLDGNVDVFNGNIDMHGGNVINVSDVNLKTNVLPVQNASGLLMQLNPKSFYYDTTRYFLKNNHSKNYGLIAQDVLSVFPELVSSSVVPDKKDSVGNIIAAGGTYKNLNYQAFISILIKAHNEQQHKIDSLKNVVSKQDSINNAVQQQLANLAALIDGCCHNNTRTNNNTNQTALNQLDIELSDKDAIVLNQNVPNPFAEQTTITYNVPASVGKAQLIFFNTNGQVIQTIDIKTRGKGKINVFASDLSSGLYNYTLVADGKVIDSKKMVRE